ncbi:MAG TPA: hypothetical protein VK922_06290 [Gemmatimonadaceae bacterium]|nr:hypothetical protein [Gemmatimonadaceae bacterium]
MSSELPRRRNLESLKKEAKRWLDALRTAPSGAPERARLERAVPNAPISPTLRDVQHALAREQGYPGWSALKAALETAGARDREAGARALGHYESAAAALLDAYRTGTPEAMARHWSYTWHRRAWQGMRSYVQGDLGRRPGPDGADVEIGLDDARYLVAVEHGFAGWEALRAHTAALRAEVRVAAKPVRLLASGEAEDSRPILVTRDWDEALRALEAHPGARLRAEGQMTDEVLADVAEVEHIEALDLAGSRGVTDDGLRQLARLSRLYHLDLSGTSVTDRGMDVLASLSALRSISLAGTRVTDAGITHLAPCEALENVQLQGTRTGDGAIRALAGKARLRRFATGSLVSDEGIPLLHELPAFKTWQGGNSELALFTHECEPNHLWLRGTFGDRGMRHMRGLDGLFGLNIDDARLAITAAALEPLGTLPRLAWLAVDATDDWMPAIARMPALRYLSAQDSAATDEGFVALSASRSIEYLWGRRCHNLRRRGFEALSRMPALRGLSVSCLNVDDAGVAALPEFPALRELMPIDVPDAGYRHIGRCDRLDSLILMYCRDTTDAATEHITGLGQLSYYFNSYTSITDRTPELLSRMDALERVTFDTCHGLTNAGLARLARLPRLRELRASGRGVTPDAAAAFPPAVEVFVV